MILHSYDRGGFLMAHSADDTPDPYYYIMHAHDVCELYYYIDGKGYYTVEGANYPLRKGMVLLMREGEMHGLHIDPSARYERLTVNFAYEAVDPNGSWQALRTLLYEREPGQRNLILLKESQTYVETLFDRLCRATEQTETGRELEVKSIFVAILSELLRLKEAGGDEEEYSLDSFFDLKIQSVGKNEGKIVFEIIGFINSHLFEIKSLEEIEAHFYFSRSYINRVFRAATGSSVWNYVLFKRLIAAQAMLKNGVPAALAAAKCGFRDYSSFYKQYKNKLGVAPTQEKMQNASNHAADRCFPLN